MRTKLVSSDLSIIGFRKARNPDWFRNFSFLAIAVLILAGCAQSSPVPTGTPPGAAVTVTGVPSNSSFQPMITASQAFVDQLVKGDFAGAVGRFDSTMKGAMPEAKLKETWQQVVTQAGVFRAQLGNHTEEKSGYKIVYVTCQFEKAVIDVQVVFNGMGQISGLFFKPGQAPDVTPQVDTGQVKQAQTMVDQMVKGDFGAVASQFDSSLASAVPDSALKQSWQQLADKMGAFNRCTDTSMGDVQGHQAVYVTCNFVNGQIDIRFIFNTQGKVVGMQFLPAHSASVTPVAYTPPAYVDVNSFHETEVTVGSGQWALPGTLSMPNGAGPFPAVVLVHGSGPNDRDETIGPNKLFRDLAWGLASQGIAVLRYDKRTMVHARELTPELVAKLTVKEETTDDALLAAQLLRQSQNIDPKRVYVLGHSLGATLAPRIGQQDPTLAGLIVMAGMTIPFEDEILRQITYLNSLSPTQTDQQKAAAEALKTAVGRVKDPNLSDKVLASDLPLGIPPAYWLDLRSYQPAEVAKTLGMPMLILQGERDYQVSPVLDFTGWKTALAQKATVVFKLYPALNHLFIAGEGAPNPTEYNTAGHVGPDVIKDIIQWVKGK